MFNGRILAESARSAVERDVSHIVLTTDVLAGLVVQGPASGHTGRGVLLGCG
jgi:hypothetical protein